MNEIFHTPYHFSIIYSKSRLLLSHSWSYRPRGRLGNKFYSQGILRNDIFKADFRFIWGEKKLKVKACLWEDWKKVRQGARSKESSFRVSLPDKNRQILRYCFSSYTCFCVSSAETLPAPSRSCSTQLMLSSGKSCIRADGYEDTLGREKKMHAHKQSLWNKWSWKAAFIYWSGTGAAEERACERTLATLSRSVSSMTLFSCLFCVFSPRPPITYSTSASVHPHATNTVCTHPPTHSVSTT